MSGSFQLLLGGETVVCALLRLMVAEEEGHQEQGPRAEVVGRLLGEHLVLLR